MKSEKKPESSLSTEPKHKATREEVKQLIRTGWCPITDVVYFWRTMPTGSFTGDMNKLIKEVSFTDDEKREVYVKTSEPFTYINPKGQLRVAAHLELHLGNGHIARKRFDEKVRILQKRLENFSS